MTDLLKDKNLRILYCPLPLTKNTEERDRANVLSLIHAAEWFTHVLVVTRSVQEVPRAIHHPTIQAAMDICRIIELPVIWGRWLWEGWSSKERESPTTGVLSHLYPSYYAAAIGRLKAEAEALGAVGTMLDAEPNGEPPNEEQLMSGLDDWKLRNVKAAIARAVDVTGQVDLIYPCGSSKLNHYSWAMADLGGLRLIHKTYPLPNADSQVVLNPPDGVKAKLDLWGHWVGENHLSPEDVRDFDMSRVRERFPENVGQWVYADKFAKTMEGWN